MTEETRLYALLLELSTTLEFVDGRLFNYLLWESKVCTDPSTTSGESQPSRKPKLSAFRFQEKGSEIVYSFLVLKRNQSCKG
jgi:hypothetical protein